MTVHDTGLVWEICDNGMKQWINIYREDIDNSVLLYFHGGPGSSTSHLDYAIGRSKAAKRRFVGKRRRSSMNDLKELGKLMKEHPVIIVVTLAAMAVGAVFGAVAFFQRWLG